MPSFLPTRARSVKFSCERSSFKSVAFEHLVIETQWMISLVIASQNTKTPNRAQMCVGSRVLEALADSAMAGREVARSTLTELV